VLHLGKGVCKWESVDERTFYAVQTQGSFRNEIGEMTETALYGHLGTLLGNDLGAVEDVIRELEDKGAAIVRFTYSLSPETTMEIRRIDDVDSVRSVLRKASLPMTMTQISRAVGRDIGPYSRILGQLEANGEIEVVAWRAMKAGTLLCCNRRFYRVETSGAGEV
jgi:hypothetical protein